MGHWLDISIHTARLDVSPENLKELISGLKRIEVKY